MNFITVAVVFLSMVHSVYQYPDGVQLINQLSEFYRLDHHIFFMDSTADLTSWFSMAVSCCVTKSVNCIPQTVYIFDNVSANNVNITESSKLEATIGKNPLLIVVVDRLKFGNDTRLLAQIKAVRLRNIRSKVGVFFARNITSLDIIEQWFRWGWSAGIMNIFCAFYWNTDGGGEPSFKVYKSDPFDAFHLMAKSESFRDYFPGSVPNYRKHPLRIQVMRDFQLFLKEVNFWHVVLRAFNATTSFTYIDHIESLGAERMDKDVSFCEIPLMNGTKAAYPHRQSALLLVVPHAKPYSDFVAYLQNRTWAQLLVFAFIVITMSSLLLIISAYLQEKEVFIFQCVADVVNLLMNDNSAIRYGSLTSVDGFVIVPLTFTGLIVMNGIVSLFQSYITSPIYQPQMNSFNDLYTSSVPILANEVLWKDTFADLLDDLSNHQGWSDKFQGVGVEQLKNEIMSFNDSIAFFLHDEDAASVLQVQKRLALKAYHVLSDTFFTRHLISFEISSVFPFTEHINDMVHRLNGAGLISKWMEEDNTVLMKTMLEGNLNHRLRIGKQSGVDSFSVPAVVWWSWIASSVVFICEIIWNKIQRRIRLNLLQPVVHQ